MEAVLWKMIPSHNWRNVARANGPLMPDVDTGPHGWNALDKFAVVIRARLSTSKRPQSTTNVKAFILKKPITNRKYGYII
jgi:hypothetical protein